LCCSRSWLPPPGWRRPPPAAWPGPPASPSSPQPPPWPQPWSWAAGRSRPRYLREADVLPAIDSWLTVIFAPHRLTRTIAEMQAAQATPATPEPATLARDTQATLADCDARLARYQATLDAGGDPQTIAEWTRQVKAERAAALARDATQALRNPSRRLTDDDIRALITALGNLRDVIRDARPAEKAAIYDQLDLKVTFKPGQAKIRAESPSARRTMQSMRSNVGIRVVSKGGLEPPWTGNFPESGKSCHSGYTADGSSSGSQEAGWVACHERSRQSSERALRKSALGRHIRWRGIATNRFRDKQPQRERRLFAR
jgi:hypothetical protein